MKIDAGSVVEVNYSKNSNFYALVINDFNSDNPENRVALYWEGGRREDWPQRTIVRVLDFAEQIPIKELETDERESFKDLALFVEKLKCKK